MNCPNCTHAIPDAAIVSAAARINASKTSEKKARAARINGKLGGRPRKVKKIDTAAESCDFRARD